MEKISSQDYIKATELL